MRLRKHADYLPSLREWPQTAIRDHELVSGAANARGSRPPALLPRRASASPWAKCWARRTSATASSAACARLCAATSTLLPAGFDLIFHPRRNVLTMEFVQLEAEVVRILEQARAEAARGAKPSASAPQAPRYIRTMTRLLLAIIAFYRRWLSPALHAISPGGCKYLPTCSEYAAMAIATHGPLRGCCACRLADCCAAIPLRAEASIPSRPGSASPMLRREIERVPSSTFTIERAAARLAAHARR